MCLLSDILTKLLCKCLWNEGRDFFLFKEPGAGGCAGRGGGGAVPGSMSKAPRAGGT